MSEKAVSSDLFPSRFADFWEVYPRKESKKDAEKAWQQVDGDSIADEIIEHVRKRARDSSQWRSKRMIPLPASFLRRYRWLDEGYETIDERRKAEDSKLDQNRTGGRAIDYPEVVRGVLGMLQAKCRLTGKPYTDTDILKTFAISSSELAAIKKRGPDNHSNQ